MKRNISLSALISVTICALLFASSCGTKRTPENELIYLLNQAPIGVKFEVEPSNITVKPSNGDYLITFKNPKLTFDSKPFINAGIANSKNLKMNIKIEEQTFLFNPGKKHLEIISAKGVDFEIFPSGLIQKKENKPENLASINSIRYKIAAVTLSNTDISPIITCKGKNFKELFAEMLKLSSFNKIVTEKCVYELGMTTEKGKNNISAEADKIETSWTIVPETFMFIYFKDAQTPDFSKLLKDGKSIIDVKLNASNLKLNIKEESKELANGTISDFSMDYLLKANEKKSAFTFSWDMNTSGLVFTAPDAKILELIFNLKEFGSKLSIDNLHPDFIKSFFEFLKISSSVDTENKEKYQQQQIILMSAMFKMIPDFFKSKPAIDFSFSPIKHQWMDGSVSGSFQLESITSYPGKITVTLSNLMNFLDNISKDNLLPLETNKSFTEFFKKNFIIDKSGNGTFTFEIKAGQPGIRFLNGVPSTLNSSGQENENAEKASPTGTKDLKSKSKK